jgi:small-conductance mechanosensitive channel/CRP-like cAMP-binding protein
MISSLVLFASTLVLGLVTPNRHLRNRLLFSTFLFAANAAFATALRYHFLTAGMQQQADLIAPLLLTLGGINGLVAVAINPWRTDRLPDRFPKIVQDAIVIGFFAVAATMVLQEKIFAATAVGAVVVGFALQDTLGNLFAGLAIQIEKPFRVGHWVRIADTDGLVTEITWRAVKIRTKSGNFVVVPNSKLSGDIIINYSEPTPETRLEIEVGTSYDNPPNVVKRVILDALKDDQQIQAVRSPEVLLSDFDDSSLSYRIRVWITEFDADERVKDRVRVALYYAFKRNGVEIPFPIQTEIQKEALPPAPRDYSIDERVLGKVSVFSSLGASEVAQLARAAKWGMYREGELVVRQGDPGSSMFVVEHGEVAVVLENGQEVARIGANGFFGEMSLLTGALRNATVRTTCDSGLLEISAGPFRQFVLANPKVVEQIGVAVATRRAELDEMRASGTAATHAEPSQTFVDRIRRYLHLGL